MAHVGPIYELSLSQYPGNEQAATHARTLINMGYVIPQMKPNDAARAPLPHVTRNALVPVAAKVSHALRLEAEEQVGRLGNAWENGQGWVVLPKDGNGPALRAYAELVRLAVGAPPYGQLSPHCCDIPVGTVAVACADAPWLGGYTG